MGDPLSIAASVAGLLSIGLQATEYLHNYYTAYRDRDDDLARVADQLGDLHHSLQVIGDVVSTQKWRADRQTIVKHIERSLARCEDVIIELRDETQKFQKGPTVDLKKAFIGAGRRAAYPFRRSTLEKIGEDVDDFRSNLSIALQALQLKEHQKTQNDLEEVKIIIKNAQAQHVATQIRQWLKAPDVTVDYNNACNKRHAGTGQWLAQSTAFKDWLHQENTFLWLSGFAGCGKSVLCSTAIQHTVRHQRAHAGSAVAFFFLTFTDESKQDCSTLLRSLLLQLCGHVAGLEDELVRLQDTFKHGMPPVLTLMEYLKQAVSRSNGVFIIVDALDESPEQTARPEVLSMIESMRKWNLPGLHLLITSRDVPDIRIMMEAQQSFPNTEFIYLRNDSIDEDIRNYVSYQVDHDRDLQRWSDADRQRIKIYLSEHAGGVFRWVKCQLDPIKRCPRSLKHLDRCLRTLPQTLDKTYERMLCGIGEESRDDAQRILSLLCFAPRPLSVAEVIEAIAVDIDDLERYDHDRQLSNADDLIRICPGLIEINFPHVEDDSGLEDNYDDEIKNNSSEGDKEEFVENGVTRLVRVGHFSVQEYLVSERIKHGPAANFALSASVEHARISKLCLIYLTNENFVTQILTRGLVEQYSLAQYAAQHWPDHYRQADQTLIDSLSKGFTALLNNKLTFDHWIRLTNADQGRDFAIGYGKTTQDYASPTYYAALLGLDAILARILSVTQGDINSSGNLYDSPLQAACFRCHENAVKLLLDQGADVNAHVGESGDTALYVASVVGHEKIVQMLLDHGADVQAQVGDFGDTPLYIASSRGHEKVVLMLLDHGANVNAVEGGFGDSLQGASFNGHGNVVKILLAYGADVNAQIGVVGTTALHEASSRGHENVVQLLLDHGADINTQAGELGDTALYRASSRGHAKVVQMLLDHGADVDCQTRILGDTALHKASSRGHETVVQMLLNSGADVNAQGRITAITALQKASSQGHEKIVQMLLDRGADVNVQTQTSAGTALYTASSQGHEKVVQMLLAHGADVNAERENYGTALEQASFRGHEKIVQMLLDHGADVNVPAREFVDTALYGASLRGHERVVQMLLDHGAEVDVPAGDFGYPALNGASLRGHETVVQMLLDHGADVNAAARDFGGTPLYCASSAGHEKIVHVLLDHGANVNAEEARYGTALQQASSHGFENVVQMLLDKGADVNRQGGLYGSALQQASSHGYEKVVKILLDNGADVDAQEGTYRTTLQDASDDGHEKEVKMPLVNDADADADAREGVYRTALQQASSNGHEKVVQMLLDHGADVYARAGDGGGRPLYWACFFGYEKIVQMLLDKGADVNSREDNYGTALQAASNPSKRASTESCTRIVQMLLAAGANANA